VIHLISLLAFDYYCAAPVAGSEAEPRFNEQAYFLAFFPPMIYSFPASMVYFPVLGGLAYYLCTVVGLHFCQSTSGISGTITDVGWWLVSVTIGYLQWFKVFPRLFKALEE
jgi:hypothetical protein